MKTVAVVNQKGGVGKTTTAINLAAALGAFERRVLLVDCDPQGNASRGLSVPAEPPLLYEVLRGEASLSECVRPTGFPGLDLVPSNRDLVGIEVEFVGQTGWERRLRAALDSVATRYDLALLDCPPSLGHLTLCALAAADGVLIPLQCEYFALEGMGELLATLKRVRQSMNPQLEVVPEPRDLPIAEGATADLALSTARQLAVLGGLQLDIQVLQGETELEVELAGPDQELLFENDGRLLLAIQHLLPRSMEPASGGGAGVRVDSQGFRTQRVASLERLAREAAEEVRRRGRPKTLHSMNPSDRRVIHLTLKDAEGVVTESNGNGFFKRITVRPA